MNNKMKAVLHLAGTCGKGVLTMAVIGANVMSLKKCITRSAATLNRYDKDIENDIATLMSKAMAKPVDVDADV